MCKIEKFMEVPDVNALTLFKLFANPQTIQGFEEVLNMKF